MAFINFVKDYERIARFRLGRFEGMMGPGVVFAFPIFHQMRKVDTRNQIIDKPRQAYVTDERGIHIYHSKRLAGHFTVDQPTRHVGIIWMEHKWKVNEMPADEADRYKSEPTA